ncbi:uncharacterized protein LOC132306550 [Cornus florida]|uniref:uncharacterized protein LOC132306550 n=1 Tax=Cornus florida TaxID=4283 RepID=UPI00289C4B51|nr:uncharacterized protein LOC132306550 [Cornus florida]XP_059659956.1 uncharacterized protein LOC132306550 [Cornus florida]XP_059659958.1 uncharacterized protein LOC132306550 [Cornus florida]XP_059659959.1 uncharacterized protein LOC132306550 [Cornus florida]XP_059659960.1 uncharacterized protein LOC132306550 [Cornus florida]XP_059659961.1 uncharacterized protein LOC132306550 [Cornus florida]XP_059659962.1 uncharacterized protein LOC132306550 [Cornus florida]
MIQLLLSEPTWSNAGHDNSVKQRIYLLNKLESVIWSLMLSGGRSEAKLWLCNTLSGIVSISPHHQRELFAELLRSKPPKQGLAAQLLQMIFEKHPHKAGHVIAKKGYMLENFFKGNPRRILQWFSSFGNGDLGPRKGAKALSQFAFVNRDICWEELEWKGKHGQSPAVVATKPHYFLDLDVEQTVENFVENVPEFWSSNEFSESLKDGEILFIDTKFFVDFFVDLIYKKDSKEVWEILNEFLMEESFSSLCHHLLIILEERDLCVFLKTICKFLKPRIKSMDFGNPSNWLEIILSKCSDFESIDQLFLLNAVISEGRQLLRLVREEEDQQAKVKIKDIVSQICTSTSHDSSLTLIMEICIKRKTIESIKWLGLQSWAIHYRLSEECQTPESWELLFINNGISFRKYNKYPLLHQDEFSEEMGSDLDEREVRVRSKKKEKRRKRRRRDIDHDDYYGDELLDFDLSNNRTGLQSKAGNWMLSTDGYSTYWSSVDLPEHLSRHCFSAWMKWIFIKWGDVA